MLGVDSMKPIMRRHLSFRPTEARVPLLIETMKYIASLLFRIAPGLDDNCPAIIG